MARITHKDYETLQGGLRDLYAHHNLDTLPRAALRLSTCLVPNELSGYNEVDPSRKRLQVVFEPAERQADITESLPIWERYMHQHPVLSHYIKQPADGPRKISDFLSNAEFRRLELYQEFYRNIGTKYQMVVTMPSPAPLVVAVALNRGKKDFTERDRKLLALMQPHLRQAYENAALITELSGELGRAYDVLERIDRGIVVIDDTCQVHSASPAAIRYSTEYFRGESQATLAKRLPETLERWAKVQIIALLQESESTQQPKPLILSGEHGRLVIRVATDREPQRYLLIMHSARPLDSPRLLEGLGLTRRETEVLYWIIAGNTNLEIGHIIETSERTVDKHCQNIYYKLKVTGRTTAITKALEWLRL